MTRTGMNILGLGPGHLADTTNSTLDRVPGVKYVKVVT